MSTTVTVALARAARGYAGLEAPFGPGSLYPELTALGNVGKGGPFNAVFSAVRGAFYALGLDAKAYGDTAWNPLGTLVARGGHVVLKPNFIRHFNPEPRGSIESVITHGAVLRAVADYAWLAVGPEGRVTIAEAPQQDCRFDEIERLAGLCELQRHYKQTLSVDLPVIDLRREEVVFRDGIIVERRILPGDPAGYRVVDLGHRSAFEGSGLDPKRFRGADYDPEPTASHHREGHDEYLLSETVLGADLIVNLPKLKTHKKTGVTLALKNLVGVNGDKNWLPHHTTGSPHGGGDEFPDGRPVDRLRSRAVELARPWLARGLPTAPLRWLRRTEDAVRGDDFVRSGNWHGNRTTWRMCLDLNRCVYYSDARGFHPEAEAPVRPVLTVLDGIVAGEGAGPLAPADRPLGVVLAGTDPVAVDLAAVRLMGFDESRIPKIREALASEVLPLGPLRRREDLRVAEVAGDGRPPRVRSLDQITSATPFRPHAGWVGHVEYAR